VSNTRTGDTVEWVRLEGIVRELFDVAVLPGRPARRGAVGAVDQNDSEALRQRRLVEAHLRRG
jgi:hypothetical protein